MEVAFSRGFCHGWLMGPDHQALVSGRRLGQAGHALGHGAGRARRADCRGTGRPRSPRRRRGLRGRPRPRRGTRRTRVRGVRRSAIRRRGRRGRNDRACLPLRCDRPRKDICRPETVEDRRSAIRAPRRLGAEGPAAGAPRPTRSDRRSGRRKPSAGDRPSGHRPGLSSRVARTLAGSRQTSLDGGNARRAVWPARRNALPVAQAGRPDRRTADDPVERFGQAAARDGAAIGCGRRPPARASDGRRVGAGRPQGRVRRGKNRPKGTVPFSK